MILEFNEFETKYLAGVYKRHWTTIYVEYMLNYVTNLLLGVHRIWNFQIRPEPDLPDSDKNSGQNSGRICRIWNKTFWDKLG